MSDDWPEATLGEVSTITKGRKPSTTNDAGKGLAYLVAEHLRGGAAAGVWVEDASAVIEAIPTDTLILWDGAGAGDVFPAKHGIVASTMARIRSTRADLDGRFLRLALEANVPRIKASNRGTTVPHVSPESLKALRVSLPPLSAQRRIVDLMAHLDNHLANLRAEKERIEGLLDSMLDGWVRELDGVPRIPLASVCSPRSGPSWAAGAESREASSGSVRVVKITNTRPDGTLDMSDETHVTGVPASAFRLNDRSLILIRTNGNRDRIGNVYRPTPQAYGCVVSAFQFAAVLGTVEERDWLYWWLKAPARQAAMSMAASGTTGLGNLAAGWLKALEVPWPDDGTRQSLVSSVEALAVHRECLAEEAASVEGIRSALLRELMSGELEIAGGYDSLLGGAA